MPARIFLSSGDLVADRRFDFARDLRLKGDLAAAADLLSGSVPVATLVLFAGFLVFWSISLLA